MKAGEKPEEALEWKTSVDWLGDQDQIIFDPHPETGWGGCESLLGLPACGYRKTLWGALFRLAPLPV